MKKALKVVRNKFFITALAFMVWMLFFDRNDIATQYEYRKELNGLKEEKAFYVSETEKVTEELKALTSDKKKLQKFAREKYLMKKDDEDVFVIVKQVPSKK